MCTRKKHIIKSKMDFRLYKLVILNNMNRFIKGPFENRVTVE